MTPNPRQGITLLYCLSSALREPLSSAPPPGATAVQTTNICPAPGFVKASYQRLDALDFMQLSFP